MVGREFAFAVPGDLSTPTGGYAYDRRIIAELRALGWKTEVLDIGSDFPRPSAAARARARAILADIPAGAPLVIDGLAFGVMADEARGLREQHPLVALVHHPLALESGISAQDATAFRASERAALALAHHVIVTSRAMMRVLYADYGVKRERMTVASPGTDRVASARGSEDGIVRLLAVGSVIPRKGYDVLVAALTRIADRPWRLTIAGGIDRDAMTVANLQTQIERAGLQARITLAGAVTDAELARLHIGADVFVLASRFEGYGMAYTEAIARGLPVIGTTGGAIPKTVPPEAAILVAPDDVGALTDALRRLIDDPQARALRAAAARKAAQSLPTWRDSATVFARVLEAVA